MNMIGAPSNNFACAVLLLIPTFAFPLYAQPSSVKDCEAVLRARDYYSYAQQNNLTIDYLRSIDYETWEEIKQSNDANFTGLFSGGLFSLSDDYNTFDQKRSRYLENVHYNRTENQALNILAITIAPRAYDAYSQCLEHLNTPGPLVWAAREDTNTIELHVKYVNPSGVAHMEIEGFVSGGSVPGSPKGHLWKDGTKWGINQEKVFTIARTPGTSETTVIVAPSDGSTPFTKTYYRADGTLTLTYIGTTDVLRVKDMRAIQHSPNNNHNRGHCPNEVGHADGKWCISRTRVSLTTSAPNLFKNARMDCNGMGCPWSSPGPTSISADGLTATGYRDNWGWDVDAVLVADEYEHVTKKQCGGDGPIPVINGQTVLFTVTKECLPIATVKWHSLINNSEGAVHFGDKTTGGNLQLESTLDNGTALLGTYKLTSGPSATSTTASK